MFELDQSRGGFLIFLPFGLLLGQRLPGPFGIHVLGGISRGQPGAGPSSPPNNFVYIIHQLHLFLINIARRVLVFCNWHWYRKYPSDHFFFLSNSSHPPKLRGVLGPCLSWQNPSFFWIPFAAFVWYSTSYLSTFHSLILATFSFSLQTNRNLLQVV